MNAALIEKLLAAPATPERAELLAAYYQAEERIEKHLQAYALATIAGLEKRRDTLWEQGREVEARVAGLRGEIASYNSWQNRLAESINAGNSKIGSLNSAHPSVRTRFPLPQEVEDWQKKKDEAVAAVDALRRETGEIKGLYQQAQRSLGDAQAELNRIVGECIAIGQQVKQLRAG